MFRLLAASCSVALLVVAAVTPSPAASPDDTSDAAVLARPAVRLDAYDVHGSSCRDVFAGGQEPGHTELHLAFALKNAHFIEPGRYTATPLFSLTEIVVHVPRMITWPGMNGSDRERAEALRAAILHHEIGHVRVAQRVVDELNVRAAPVEPDVLAFGAAADAIRRDGFARFNDEQRAYDDRTDHGRDQEAAPGILRGADTKLVCR